MSDKPSCETCRFWQHDNDGRGNPHGWCQRNAPSPRLVADFVGPSWYAEWPLTMEDEWCGEYQPRVPLPMAPPA